MKSNWPIAWLPACFFIYRDVFLKRPTDIREYAAGGFKSTTQSDTHTNIQTGTVLYIELQKLT